MSEQELLAVLDISEAEQVEFFYINGYRELVDTFPAGGLRVKYGKDKEIISVTHSQSELRFDRRALADLAFRLRDEVIEKNLDWDDALVLVWKKLGRSMKYQTFCKYYAQPLHWIIAALIAKNKENETT